MKRWQASLVLLLALAQTWGVLCWTLTANQSASLYPTNGDSIGIALIEGMFNSVFLFCLSQSANGLLRSPGASMSVYRKVAFALLALLTICFATLLLLYWAYPNHYAIACSYALFLLVLFIVGTIRWRQR